MVRLGGSGGALHAQRQHDAEQRSAVGQVLPQEPAAHFQKRFARSEQSEPCTIFFGRKQTVPEPFGGFRAQPRAVVPHVVDEGVGRAGDLDPDFGGAGAQPRRGEGLQRVAHQIEQAAFEAFGIQRDGV